MRSAVDRRSDKSCSQVVRRSYVVICHSWRGMIKGSDLSTIFNLVITFQSHLPELRFSFLLILDSNTPTSNSSMRFLCCLVLSYAFFLGHDVNASVIDRNTSPALMSLEDRQTDCEKNYGVYPEYTGPCEATSTLGSLLLILRSNSCCHRLWS